MSSLAKFKRQRNKTLLSLDENRIRKFMKESCGCDMPEDQNTFWAAVHKSITAIEALPLDFRKKSKQWLIERGFTSFDDGNL